MAHRSDTDGKVRVGRLGDARCLRCCVRLRFLTNIHDRWIWIFKQTTAAKEIWTVLQEHFRPKSQAKKSLTMCGFTSSKPTEEGADVTIPAHESNFLFFFLPAIHSYCWYGAQNCCVILTPLWLTGDPWYSS